MQDSVFNSLLKALKPACCALSLALVACQAPATLPVLSDKADAPLSVSVQTRAQTTAQTVDSSASKPGDAALPDPVSKTNVLPAALLKNLPTQVASLKLQSERSSFTAVGQSSRVSLQLLDAEGKEVASSASLRWSSSHPDRIAVTSTGALSATLNALSAVGPAEIIVQLAGTELKASLKIGVQADVTENSGSSSGGSSGGGGGGGFVSPPAAAAAPAGPATESLGGSLFFDGLGLGEFKVNTFFNDKQNDAQVASNSQGNFVVVWVSNNQDGSGRGVYAQRFNSQGLPQGSEFRVNTTTTNEQYQPAVAMDSTGNFVVTWTSYNQDGSNSGVYAQRYNAAGGVEGTEFRVNVTTTGEQFGPSIGIDANGRFVIAYSSQNVDGNGYAVEAVRFDATGQVLGNFQVNTFTTGDQRIPRVGMNSSGQFVITWNSADQDGDGIGVYAQRYASDGNAAGTEFRVNTNITGNQSTPAVALGQDGRFLLVWESSDGTSTGIYAQRYAADGSKLGDEFRVNTTTANAQDTAAVAVDSAGNYFVAWESFSQDGSDDGIFAQRLNAEGVAQGHEFQVNTISLQAQNGPAMAVGANGGFVVVWEGSNIDANNTGVAGKRFNAQGIAL